MATPPRPVSRFSPVWCTVVATLLFAASAQAHSFLRGLCLGAGLALLGIAVLLATRTMRGGPQSGWLPSRHSAPPRDGDASR